MGDGLPALIQPTSRRIALEAMGMILAPDQAIGSQLPHLVSK